jgi:hypothetical protein
MRQANVILQRNTGKRKTKQNYPGFEFKPRQVNDSSQSNQGTDHLVSQDVRGLTTTFQGCALATDTPTLTVVRNLVEHDQPNH